MASVTPEEVNDYLTCSICMEEYKEPKVLACLHTYCKECLVKLVKNKGPVICCPECRQDTKVSVIVLHAKIWIVCEKCRLQTSSLLSIYYVTITMES